MTTQELEQAIRDIIKRIYCKEYQGLLKVKKLPCGYEMIIGLNKDERPICIATDGTSEEFLKFIEKELKERGFNRTDYFTAIRIYSNECEK